MRWARAAYRHLALVYWHLALALVLMVVGGYAGFVIAARVMPTHASRSADDPSWRVHVALGGLVGFIGTGLLVGLYAWLVHRDPRRDSGV